MNNEFSLAYFDKHPFFISLSNGTLSSKDIQLFAEQYYLLSKAFVNLLLLASTNIKEDVNRLVLIDNLYDEHGRGNSSLNHRELFKKFLLSTGCKGVNEIKPLDSTAAYIYGMNELCRNGSELEVLGALGPGCEAITINQYMQIKSALEKFYNFSNDELIFFTSHIKHDPRHTFDIENVISSLAGEQNEQATSGTNISLIFEKIFWDGLYNACSVNKNA